MKLGTLYGIGVGPGDPELLTVKAVSLLARCRHVFVPKARSSAESVALDIARRYLRTDALVHEMTFLMTSNQSRLQECWNEAAQQIARTLETGEDACFLTLGDPLLYSTYIYLLRALKNTLPGANVATIPGVTSFSAAAALTNFAIGEGKEWVTIVPAADDLTAVRQAMDRGGAMVLMKVAGRLPEVLTLLEEAGLMDEAVFVARAGQEGQRIETDLRKLRAEQTPIGYLSVILVHAHKREAE